MILIAVGSNMPSSLGSALQTIFHVPKLLSHHEIALLAASNIYITAPIGVHSQHHYYNAVFIIETTFQPKSLLAVLKKIEIIAGRVRSIKMGSRPLDLDILSYRGIVCSGDNKFSNIEGIRSIKKLNTLVLPHPEMALRPFVVRPLMDVAPLWHHPVTGESPHMMWQRIKHEKKGAVISCHGPLLNND